MKTNAIRLDSTGKEHEMVLIGSWMELCYYYSCANDGNTWCYQNGKWINQGDLETFKERALAGKFRGTFNF